MKITLRAARHNKKLLQTDLAKACGVSRKTIGAWESGISMPTPDKIDTLCRVLGVSYDDIKWKP